MSDTNSLRRLGELGQSPWLDNIHRAMLNSGELERLIEQDGLRGITSNPAIFEKALKDAHEYDQTLRQALERDPRPDARELFYILAARDIQDAADRLRTVYDATDRVDGMVSLEVSPDLAYDTDGTIREARELFDRLDRPNVMIKVPGTRAGLPAIETLIAEGINVNVTLLFSVERYLEVADAYLKGLEQRLNSGQPVNHIRSVASFFVSRVDSALDPQLQNKAPELQGKLAIANAKRAYRRFQQLYDSDRFAPLKAAGARPQRLLWASTGTKNPDYSDVLYVDNLIGPDTVNTLPPATFDAFRDHGRPEVTLDQGLEQAEAALEALPPLGIDLTEVTDRLEREGVEAFAKSFDNLLATIRRQAEAIR